MVNRGKGQEQLILSKIDLDFETGCWNWTGSKHERGYGHIHRNGTILQAHRVSYEIFKQTIPKNHDLDHLCRNEKCVNPSHLEPVSHRENVLRGISPLAKQAQQTHCKRGHPLSGKNLYVNNGSRRCQTCHSMHNKNWEIRNAK